MALLNVNPAKSMPSASTRFEDVDKVLKKSVVLKTNFDKRHIVPPYEESLRAMRKKRKAERELTTGKKWFNMGKGSLEDGVEDLEFLKMRSSLGAILGKKQFYRASDSKRLPKYFQRGEIVEGAADFYSGRVPKRQRKKTIVEELLADAAIRKNQDTKYQVIADREARKKRSAANRRMKRFKKNKK